MTTAAVTNALTKRLQKLPYEWDGRASILEMKNAGSRQWKQMEWIGWYFEYLCEKELGGILEIPGPRYARVGFDGFNSVAWDFKTHPLIDARGKVSNEVITNDKVGIDAAIRKSGKVGVILAIGHATFDDSSRSFQKWHKELKGGLSAYEKKRVKRKAPSRVRKSAFRLTEVRIFLMDAAYVKKCKLFQKGMRNSNGSKRKDKVLLNLVDTKPVAIVTF